MCLAALLRRATLALVVTGLASQIALAASTESVRADGVTVRQGAEWVSPPSVPVSRRVDIRDLPAVPDWKPGDPIIEVPRQFYGDPNAPTPVPVNPVDGEDPLAARQRAWSAAREGRGGGGFTTPTVNAEGIRTTASPNDPTGDVGTLQFVMAINASGGSAVGVFNKTTGAQIGPTFTMASLVTGGTCATSGAGDPIVLFDAFANRWVLTEFTGTGNLLCVYLSSSDDLSQPQTWTRYAFNFPAFPDYPKYGVWPQAYFVGANENGTGGRRPFYAMDRARMLAGQPATVQRLTIPNLAGFGFQMTQPAHVSGTTLPPAGTPGLFMRHRDDEAHNASSNNPNADFLELFEFNVDWTTPANSNIVGPITFQIAEFSSNLNGLTAFNAFPQPNGQRLDPLRETVMHRLVYRRFATHESLVGNFVTDLYLGPSSIYPDDTGAVRWFELRRGPEPLPPDVLLRDGFEDPAFGVTWRLHQEGTFAPEDTPGVPANQADRWMGGINIDESGNLALAYNIVRQSPAIPAGLRYTGRLEADPLGVMTEPETVIVNGNGVTGTGSAAERWGDYADMGVDPVDGCTFWFVGNYANQTLNPSNSRANRFVAVRHDACGEPSLTLRATPESVAVCANSTSTVNAPPIQLQVTHTGGLTDPAALSFAPLPTGVSASANPTTINAPGGTSQITLGANNTAPAGPNAVTVQAVAGTVNRTLGLTLNVVNAAPAAPTLTAPADGATAVPTSPTFTWNAVTGAVDYVIEASTSNTFGTLIFQQTVTGTSFTPASPLPPNTQIFWRVRARNACGEGVNSTVRSFTTAAEYCRTPNLAIPDGNLTGVSDNLVITGTSGNVANLDVRVNISHTWVGDLRLRLTRVSDNTTINLVTNPTNSPSGSCSGDNMDATFDDSASVPAQQGCVANVVPTFAGFRIPQQALSTFNGQTLNGTWRLTVIDSIAQDTGTLNSWCLLGP
jgi:hypothetical protein